MFRFGTINIILEKMVLKLLLILLAFLCTATSKINQVVVLTQGRSGSTFIGELLSQISGALYLYEPCRSITMTFDKNGDGKFGEVDETKCQNMVANLLACTITVADATALFKDWVAISKCSIRGIVDLAPKRIAVDKKVSGYNNYCLKSPLRIIKEIRLVTPGNILMNRKETAILHLVRDIRAVVNSRLLIDGFCLHKGAPGCARPICEEMQKSFDGMASVRSSSRYRLIRFEDVCDHPEDMSNQIYQWLGFKMEPSALNWVKSSTSAKKAPDGAGKFGTQRSDPSHVAHGWEVTLGVPEISKLNSLCGSILQNLGYDLNEPLKHAMAAVAATHISASDSDAHLSTTSTATASNMQEPWWKKNARLKQQQVKTV